MLLHKTNKVIRKVFFIALNYFFDKISFEVQWLLIEITWQSTREKSSIFLSPNYFQS